MNVLRPFILAAALAVACAAHGADKRETRPVAQFHAVMLAAPVKLEVVQGESEELLLQGDERALADIESVVEGGTLEIRVRPGVRLMNAGRITGTVNVRKVDSLSIHGNGDLHAGKIADILVGGRAERFRLTIAGSGDVKAAALESRDVAIDIAGSGGVKRLSPG